jgi:hypothetical protein
MSTIVPLTSFHIPTSNGAQSGGSGAGFATGTYTLATLSTDHLPTFNGYDSQLYVANGWDACKVWDGVSATLVNAGIASGGSDWAPSPSSASGSVAIGVHLLRYRYRNSRTGYVSDPSKTYSATVSSSTKKLTFNIGDSGSANIVRSTDSKADTIVVEMTAAGGTTFFEAETAAMTASTVAVDIGDDALAEMVLDYDDDGHGVPPACALVEEHNARLWLGGRVVHSSGTCSVTNGSTTVTLDNASLTDAILTAYLAIDGDTKNYSIASKTNSSVFELGENYTGTTGTGKSYSIFWLESSIVFWSKPGYPESFDPDNYAIVLKKRGDTLSAMKAYSSCMLLFGQHSIDEWRYTEDPADGMIRSCTDERGALNQQCVIEAHGRVFVMDKLGFYQWACPTPTPLSGPIDEMVPDVNWAQSDKFHGVYSPQEKCIRWFYCADSDTYPQNFFEFDLENNTWSTGRLGFGVRASAVVQTDNARRVLYGDRYGYTWYAGIGRTDGSHPDYTLVGTVGSGSTNQVIPIDEAGLYTTGDGLDGVELYWKEGEEAGVIQSNTADTVTLKSALSAVPDEGDTVYIGRIAGKLKTKAIALRRPDGRQENLYAHVFFVPTPSSRKAICRVYEDYSSTAKSDYAAKSERGVTYTASSDDIEIDLGNATGMVRIPLSSSASHVVELEFEFNEPDTAARILGVSVGGEAVEAED